MPDSDSDAHAQREELNWVEPHPPIFYVQCFSNQRLLMEAFFIVIDFGVNFNDNFWVFFCFQQNDIQFK